MLRGCLKLREGDVVKGIPITPKVNQVTLKELYEDMVTDYQVNNKRTLTHMKCRFEKHILPFFGENAEQRLSQPQK